MEHEDLQMHFIDKLHTTLLTTGKSINRSMMVLFVLALLLLTTASGAVSPGEKVTLSGLSLNIAPWVLPVALSFLLTASFVHILGLSRHEHRIRDKILQLYDELGLEDEILDDLQCNPLEQPNLITSVFSQHLLGKSPPAKIAFLLGVVLVLLLMFVLPFLAQGFAFYRLIHQTGWTWWLAIAYAYMFALMLSYTIAFFAGEPTSETPNAGQP